VVDESDVVCDTWVPWKGWWRCTVFKNMEY
jgi:hypothetical protein